MSNTASNPCVLIVHPGTQYAAHLARQCHRHGLLLRYWTGFAIAEESSLGRLAGFAPDKVRRRVAGRWVAEVPGSAIRTQPWLEWRAHRQLRRQSAEDVYFERNRAFQEAIPDAELRRASVVVGYDTSSWILARRARALGQRFILDQSIGHPAVKERTFAGLRERYPAWSATAPAKAAQLVAVEREEHVLADSIVVPSHFVRATLVEEGVDPSKVRVIPFGTDLDVFYPPDSVRSDGTVRVLFVGGLTARKGLPVLLKAWRELAPTGAELWVVGPGKIPDAEERTLPRSVRVLGAKSREEVAALMRAVDVFVFPSFFEGLAQVQVEALASGLPVIATREAGAEDIVRDGETGFVVPAGDVSALACAMRRFMEDESLRGTMQKEVRACREGLSWNVYGDRWAELLRSTIV